MAGGQQIASAHGSIGYELTVALVGLALTASAGTLTPTGTNSASLTGEAITSAHGAVTLSSARTLTGIQREIEQGVMNPRGRSLVATFAGDTLPDMQVPLGGQALTAFSGVITGGEEGAPVIVGQASTGEAGTVTPGYTRALTGEELTGAQGAFTLTNRPTGISGSAITGEMGVVDPSGFSLTAHLSGQECTFTQGMVDATPVLTGVAVTSAAGTLTYSIDVALVGEAITSAQGPTIVEQNADDLFIQSQQGATTIASTVALIGEAITGAQGTVSLNDGEQGLVGSASTSAAGSVTTDVSCLLTGETLTAAQYPMGAPGYAELTGQVLTGQQGDVFTDNDRTASITGSSLTASVGAVSANPRQAMTSAVLNSGIGQMGRSGGNMSQALTGHSLTTSQGTVGVVGPNPIPQTPSLEGCGITSGVAQESVTSEKTSSSEGCFVTSGSANEVA